MGAVIEEHPEVQVFDEISLIEHGVRVAITRALPVGLTYPQYEVLNLIARLAAEWKVTVHVRLIVEMRSRIAGRLDDGDPVRLLRRTSNHCPQQRHDFDRQPSDGVLMFDEQNSAGTVRKACGTIKEALGLDESVVDAARG